jgi:hypothetical protein
MRRVGAWLCVLVLLSTSTGWANDAAHAARQEFERGYVLAQEGDLQGSRLRQLARVCGVENAEIA